MTPPSVAWTAIPPRALGAYLARQRWSGARGATIDDLRVETAIPFPLGDDAPPCALLIVAGRVRGETVRWQLPTVAFSGDEGAGGDVLWHAPEHVLVDATHHPAFAPALLAAIRQGRHEAHPGATLRAEPMADVWACCAGAPEAHVGTAEQSNTSIRYGEVAILKLFRRLESGPQPDVEIGRFLAACDFPYVPRLLGVLEVDRGDSCTVLGMLQALVPAAQDAWAHTVASAERFLRATDVAACEAALARDEADAAQLGAVTRALHDALGAGCAAGVPSFAPAPALHRDLHRWSESATRALDAALVALDGVAGQGSEAAELARLLLVARADALRGEIRELELRVGDDAGVLIRHHGDYHLGQVLRGADGSLAIIDFEGEPARPLPERRACASPLRDVAGMLRSLGYAASAAARDEPVEPSRRVRWERAVRRAFLDAYFRAPAADVAPTVSASFEPAYLPRARAHADALVRLFELEKLFYELRYEVLNRPDWLDIPLRGLTALLAELSDAAPAAEPPRAPADRPDRERR